MKCCDINVEWDGVYSGALLTDVGPVFPPQIPKSSFSGSRGARNLVFGGEVTIKLARIGPNVMQKRCLLLIYVNTMRIVYYFIIVFGPKAPRTRFRAQNLARKTVFQLRRLRKPPDGVGGANDWRKTYRQDRVTGITPKEVDNFWFLSAIIANLFFLSSVMNLPLLPSLSLSFSILLLYLYALYRVKIGKLPCSK